MVSLLHLLASDVSPAGSGIAPLIGIVLFFAFFAVTGFLYLKKKRAERIDALTAELDKPLTPEQQRDQQQAQLPSSSPDAVVVPRAQELVLAEKNALLARAEADAAAREAKRAAIAAESGDADARARADAAKARENEAAQKLALAAETAKSLRLALGKTRDGIMGRISAAIAGVMAVA